MSAEESNTSKFLTPRMLRTLVAYKQHGCVAVLGRMANECGISHAQSDELSSHHRLPLKSHIRLLTHAHIMSKIMLKKSGEEKHVQQSTISGVVKAYYHQGLTCRKRSTNYLVLGSPQQSFDCDQILMLILFQEVLVLVSLC